MAPFFGNELPLGPQEINECTVEYPITFRRTSGIRLTGSRNVHVTISTSGPSTSGCYANGKNTKSSGTTNWGNFFMFVIGW